MSLVILTYNKADMLEALLETVSRQKTDFFIEVIVADNGCFDDTRRAVTASFAKFSFLDDKKKRYSYAPFCNNLGYAMGNNRAVMEGWVSPKAKWLLFLNDDVTLHPNFLHHMLDMGESKPNAGAVGCMILNEKGDEVLEAGSMIWSDASCAGYGRGRLYGDWPELSYARPVDYVSGACLMIQSDIFKDYGGFQHELFPNYYEDSDLQMHVQHDLGKEVWFQPRAKVNHHEHGSFGHGQSATLMQKAVKVFRKKWKEALDREHLPSPKTPKAISVLLERGRDTRFRKSDLVKILYIDEKLPNPSQGSGFGRSYDNVKMLADLGHFVTVTVVDDPKDWCDNDCIENLEIKAGVEVIRPMHGSIESLIFSRIGFYDVVITTRPGALDFTRGTLQKRYQSSPFVLLYDAEALMFRRDELLLSTSRTLLQPFPGTKYTSEFVTRQVIDQSVAIHREWELGLLRLADIIVTVSDQERQLLKNMKECGKYGATTKCKLTTSVHTVGHIMDAGSPTATSFDDRRGILFVGAFHGRMYYNGDAIWYFVTEIFPLIVKESKGAIPLTIAGREIPKVLRETVEQNPVISEHVKFLDSPPDLMELYNQHRLVLAPHLYGAGIQYKVCTHVRVGEAFYCQEFNFSGISIVLKLSEAFSLGVPVVMSAIAAGNFGISAQNEIGCVGDTVLSFKQCVLDVHNDRTKWSRLRTNGIEFIKRTHNRTSLLSSWAGIMQDAMARRKGLPKCDAALDFIKCTERKVKGECPEGEQEYKTAHTDVAEAIKGGYWASAWEHFDNYGRDEGRTYSCCQALCIFGAYEEAMCAAGESSYLEKYPDVKNAVEGGLITSAWEHFIQFGKAGGRTYSCCKPQTCPHDTNARLISSPDFLDSDVLCQMELHQRDVVPDMELLPSVERCLNFQASFCSSGR
jgi:GT2 family glycosyltransferase/glycosyltransferase involved in cell wall biosynthesis